MKHKKSERERLDEVGVQSKSDIKYIKTHIHRRTYKIETHRHIYTYVCTYARVCEREGEVEEGARWKYLKSYETPR